MSVFAGPRTPYQALRDGSTGSFWSPRVLSSLWQDTAGTIPAVVNSEVKRMDDLGGLNNHMLASTGTRVSGDHTYVYKGPILRRENNTYYLETDGDGAGLRTGITAGNWPEISDTSQFGITLCVAFQTDSDQGNFGSLGGTWLGSDSIGNFGPVWHFGLRLSSEIMFYATVRNAENTAWVTQFEEGNRYSALNNSAFYDKPVIYTAIGLIDNATFAGRDYINQAIKESFTATSFNATTELPVPFYSQFVLGARAPSNDNWIKGRFYGGAMIAKEINENERKIVEKFLYTNCFG